MNHDRKTNTGHHDERGNGTRDYFDVRHICFKFKTTFESGKVEKNLKLFFILSADYEYYLFR